MTWKVLSFKIPHTQGHSRIKFHPCSTCLLDVYTTAELWHISRLKLSPLLFLRTLRYLVWPREKINTSPQFSSSSLWAPCQHGLLARTRVNTNIQAPEFRRKTFWGGDSRSTPGREEVIGSQGEDIESLGEECRYIWRISLSPRGFRCYRQTCQRIGHWRLSVALSFQWSKRSLVSRVKLESLEECFFLPQQRRSIIQTINCRNHEFHQE